MSAPSIGLQLYTLRSLQLPLDDLLAGVAAIGYTAVETHGMQGVGPEELRAALGRHGLEFVSAHVALRSLRDDPRSVMADYRAAGAGMIVVPFLEVVDRPAARAGWEDLARELDAIGAVATSAGLPFAYHHHAFELEPIEGGTPLEVLLEGTGAEHVGVELDVGWLQVAGHDPALWIDRVAERCVRVHAKDVARVPAAEHPWADVGDGVVAWPDVLAASRRAGVAWWLVEHDAPDDPWRSVEQSYEALRRLLQADRERST
ncbi:MAG: sugar phosphate isomerase/epimerase [Trueperaceae bacterium]|nr:sugar phosphate isomerase/epimerase [Trueperaceae bacterium]